MTLTEQFANNNATKQKAAAYDAMIQKAQMQEAIDTARGFGREEGLATALMAAENQRMPEGNYANSVDENAVILPTGEAIPVEQTRGLAGRVMSNTVPIAETQNPTYRGR